MDNEFVKWFGGVITSVGVLSLLGYIIRDSLRRFFTKAVEHNFDKKLEKFKSDIRNSESEIAQIRSYISSARSGRDSIFQTKKIEAAEKLIMARQFLCKFNMAIMYVKMLKIDELYKQINDPKIQKFIDAIITPLKLDDKLNEYNKIDKDTPRLYLNDKVISAFDFFEGITLMAAAKLRILEVSVDDNSNFITTESLVSKIKELMPQSKEGFDKYGDVYIFSFHDYFYKKVVSELRSELVGDGNMARDTELAARLVFDFRETQQKVKSNISKYGLSEDLINNSEEGKD